jgi:hypothetical protein
MNNLKKIFVTLGSIFFIHLGCYSAELKQRSSMINVIPYAINQQNGSISLLLNYTKYSNCSPLKSYKQPDAPDSIIAQNLLQAVYRDFHFKTYHEYIGKLTDNHYYFVEVPYINVYDLAKQSQISLIWVPGDLAASSRSFTTQRLARTESITLSQSFFEFLHRNWSTLKSEFLNQAPQHPAPITAPQPQKAPITWQEYKDLLDSMEQTESERKKIEYTSLKVSAPYLFKELTKAESTICQCFT